MFIYFLNKILKLILDHHELPLFIFIINTFKAATGLPTYISHTITKPSLLHDAKYLLQ